MRAEPGSRGETKEMAGRGGEDLVVLVPVGTIVSDAENGGVIVDLMYDGAEFLLCEGGK